MGLLLGLLIGILGEYNIQGILTLGIQMAAVLILLPRMVALLMEGLSQFQKELEILLQRGFQEKKYTLVWTQLLLLVTLQIWR